MGLFDFFKGSKTSYILTPDGNITVVKDGQTSAVGKSHPNHEHIVKAILDNRLDGLDELINVPMAIERSFNDVTVTDGEVFYKGEPLHNTLTDRILGFMRDGEDFEPLARFLNNLMKNPSKQSVDQLYSFLEHSGLAITEDGCFMAYKGVSKDFKDLHTHSFDNRPGNVHEMPRNMVDDNPMNHCSHGFHVGTHNYASTFGPVTVMVKVNPRDAVSVPSDHNAEKLRVCRYEVVKICQHIIEEPVFRGEPDKDYLYFDEGMQRWRKSKGGQVVSASHAASLGYV